MTYPAEFQAQALETLEDAIPALSTEVLVALATLIRSAREDDLRALLGEALEARRNAAAV